MKAKLWGYVVHDGLFCRETVNRPCFYEKSRHLCVGMVRISYYLQFVESEMFGKLSEIHFGQNDI